LFIEYGGIIENIESALIFENMSYTFLDFIKNLEQFKKSDNISKHVGKLVINSLYGRLGMSNRTTKTILSDNNENCLDYIFYENSIYVKNIEDNRRSISNIAISSAIASKARIKLYRNYINVINYGGRLLYSDTDSIIAAYSANKYPLDMYVGDIFYDSKKQDTVIIKALFTSGKSYAIVLQSGTEIIKIKGVNTTGVTFDEFYKAFFEKEKIIFYDQVKFSKKSYTINISYIKKVVYLTNYNKRLFIDNYTDTKPKSSINKW
jgi:hypothetical protein